MPVANLWTRSATDISTGIANSKMLLHASSTTYSNLLASNTNSYLLMMSWSMFIFCSCTTWIAPPSWAWSSTMTPSCSWYSISCSRVTKFKLMPFMLLITAWSSPLTTANVPSGKRKVLPIWACSDYSASMVPDVTYWAIVPIWGCCTCKPCSCVLSTPNIVLCSICNLWSVSSATSRIILLISNRSPSMSVNRSKDVFVAFPFFLRIVLSRLHSYLICADVVLESMWSSSL